MLPGSLGLDQLCQWAEPCSWCPQMQIVSSNFSVYSDYSKKVMAILHQYTDLVEQLSIDEAFLDVTDFSSTYHRYCAGDANQDHNRNRVTVFTWNSDKQVGG